MIEPVTFVPLFAASVHLFMFSYIFGQMQKSPVNYAFLVISGGLALICLQEFLIYLPIPVAYATRFGHSSLAILLLVAIANLYFVYAIVRKGKLDRLFMVLTGGILIAATFCLFIKIFKIETLTGIGRITPTAMYIPLFLLIALSLLRSAYLLVDGWKHAEIRAIRHQCRLLFTGNVLSIVLCMFALVILPFFLKNMDFFRYNSLTTVITMIFIYRAMQKYGFMVVDLDTIRIVSDMLFRNVNYGIIVTDKAGHILQSNQLAEEILNQPKKPETFEAIRSLLPKVDFSTRFTGRIVEYSLDHQVKLLEISHADFKGSHPQLGSMLFFRDVTEQRRREDASADKLRLESLGRLAGGVAHDFNNQLAGIMGCADLLREDLASHPESRHLADVIVEAAERSAKLTRQMLAFSRRGNFQKMPVDMCSTVSDAISILEHSIDKRIKISRQFSASRCIVSGDPEQLHHTILNIALNARDAMPDGGNLDFIVENIEKGDEHSEKCDSDAPPAHYVRIIVKDSGVGIPPELQSKVFEPFFTTKEKGKGTGMGLAAAYGTINAHHGTIQLKSAVGKGTEIIIELPTSSPHPSATVPKTTPSADSIKVLQGLRILIVEDEPMIIAAARETFHRAGIITTAFERGNEAVAYFTSHAQEIDLVLLDLVLPDTTGHQVFLDLKKIDAHVRVLLSSGYIVDGGVQQILDLGAVGFIQKPYQTTELLTKVREAVQEKH